MWKRMAKLSQAFIVAGGVSAVKTQEARAQDTGRHCQVGEASYYADAFQGRKTANGERFNMHALTAASRAISNKSGERARVTNLSNGESVVVRINDYGPHAKTGRIIDLSKAAAGEIDMIHSGVARVRVCVL